MNCIRKISVIKSTLVSPRGKFLTWCPGLPDFQRSSTGCQCVHLFRATDANGRFVTYFQTSNGLFVSMEEVRVTLCRRKVWKFFGRVRMRFVRMRSEQRNSAWIETESARSAAEVSFLVVLYGRLRRGGGKGGGVGKIVKYGGISNDRSPDKKSHKVRFEQALFKQIGPQLCFNGNLRRANRHVSSVICSSEFDVCLSNAGKVQLGRHVNCSAGFPCSLRVVGNFRWL